MDTTIPSGWECSVFAMDFFKEIWIEPEKYITQMICILVAFVALLVYIMFAAHKKKSHE